MDSISLTSSESGESAMAQTQQLPIRLHHNAYVTRDQEKTRQFYEEVIGLPLIAAWSESDELLGEVRTYGIRPMASGTALARRGPQVEQGVPVTARPDSNASRHR
jgi:catechol 2,3-dioxygenase-like lactoylglutathione lyase family enzyme